MGYKPAAGFRAGGGFKPGGNEAESDSLFWKAMDVINRPSSATFGAATALVEGDDPFARAMKALRGEQEYTGTDLLTSMGADPASKITQAAGFGLTVLNPLDPLNYLGGLGGATRAGKAAKLLGKGAENWGDAARLGERALLSLGGHRIPLPGDAAILEKMQQAGKAVQGSAFGRAMQTLFGGKAGALNASGLPEHAKAIVGINDSAEQIGRQFQMETDPFIRAMDVLKGDDRGNLLETLGQAGRGDMPWDVAEAGYVRPGQAGAEKRKAAWDAAGEFMRARKGFVGRLEGTGIDAYATPTTDYFSRVATPLPGTDAKEALGAKIFDEKLGALKGPANNAFNRMLLPGSVEPVSEGGLTQAGREAFRKLGGPEEFRRLEKEDPQFVAEFLRQHRLTPKELNDPARGLGWKYETDAATVFKRMRDDAIANVKGDELVRLLEKQGVAKPWDEAVHGAQADDGRWLFSKVDQGRYAEKPLAVPVEYSRALQRFFDTTAPSAEGALMGAMINQALPDMLKNAGLMQWWKGLAIFGGGPSYFVRNFAAGVAKNRYEGLTMWNGQTPRLYSAAIDTIGRALRGNWSNDVIDLGGVKISKERLYQEYMTRGMAGGGMPDVDIVTAGSGASKKAREKVFRIPHAVNEQVEMAVRMPLAMKMIEDTFVAAKRAGIPLPEVVGPLSAASKPHMQAAVEDIVSRAFDNAAKQVKLSHFDYTDLSPFEERLRSFWVPFYTWMRKNIPHETVNMLQRPGQYMPFARAWFQGLRQSGLKPEDMPEWLAQNFAIPIGETPDGRKQFVDLTGFVPFMDVIEAGTAIAGKPRTGEGRVSELGRYVASRFNPFLQEAAEQTLQKEFLTGRSFGETPAERFGVTMSPQMAGALEMARPVRELDRLNPGGVFTKLGNAMGSFTGDVRPHRNEPSEAGRWARFGLGIKTYGADADQANWSKNQRKQYAKKLISSAKKARREGRQGEAAYLLDRAEQVMGQ